MNSDRELLVVSDRGEPVAIASVRRKPVVSVRGKIPCFWRIVIFFIVVVILSIIGVARYYSYSTTDVDNTEWNYNEPSVIPLGSIDEIKVPSTKTPKLYKNGSQRYSKKPELPKPKGHRKNHQYKQKNWLCSNKLSIPWTKKMCRNMEYKQNPCGNFYDYTCGGWKSRVNVPNGQESWDRFSETTYSINMKIKHTFDAGNVIGSAERKAKTFYQQCMNENRQHRNQALKEIRSYLINLKGSPLMSSTMSRHQLVNLMTKMHQHGVWSFLELSVRVHPQNTTKQILMIYPGTSPFSGEYVGLTDRQKETLAMVAQGYKKRLNTLKEYKEELSENESDNSLMEKSVENEKLNARINEKQGFLERMKGLKLPLTTPKHRKALDKWLRNRKELVVGKEEENNMLEIHKDYNMLIFKAIWQVSMTSITCPYWDHNCTPKKSEAAKLTNDMLWLEIDLLEALVKGFNTSIDNYGESKDYVIKSVGHLQSECNAIDWKKYLRTLTKQTVTDNTEVMLLEEQNILEVCRVINKYTSSSDKSMTSLYSYDGSDSSSSTKMRSFANYLLMSLAKSLINSYDTHLIFDNYKDSFKQDYKANHLFNCMVRTNEAFGLATGSIYIRQITNKKENKTIENVQQIVSYVKKAFKTKILTDEWLDNVTRLKAERKIDLMLDKVGYPADITNAAFRDAYYEKFHAETGWLNNLVSWKKFRVTKMLEDLEKPFDRTRWSLTPATVNAEHAMIRNDMNLPISLFQLPFYSPDRPMVMNFGSLGSIIGHEMTHAFGKSGSQFDEYGRMNDWMTRSSEELLVKKSKCLIKQYETFSIHGHKSNPNKSIDEDIADTAGIRAAYYAYQFWKDKNGDDIDSKTASWMKSHNVTEEQLFFIAFSQNYCEKYTSDGLKSLAQTHSPGPFRVKGSLSNTKFFQEAFSCPDNSAYSPMSRCRVW